MNDIKYICRECGKTEFTDSLLIIKKREKLCKDCNSERLSELKKKTKVLLFCLSCGKKFKGYQNNSLYCSHKCREYERKKKEKKKREKVCERCGKSFISVNAKYCSKECRKKGIELKRLKSSLNVINREMEASKIKVYTAQIK